MRLFFIVLIFINIASAFAEYEEGYSAYREEQWAKMTRPKAPPYPDTEFQLKQNWIELSDERKFFWWWKAKYAMGASKRDKEIMQQYMTSCFIGGAKRDNAPSWDEYFKQKKSPSKKDNSTDGSKAEKK